MGESSPPDVGPLYPVRTVAERLDVAAATLRTWERRYGIGPSLRTDGGHRRYTEADLARVEHMRRLLEQGVAPEAAARAARDLPDDAVLPDRPGADHDSDHWTADQVVEAILDAAVELDVGRLSSLFSCALHRRGALAAWTDVLKPAMDRISSGSAFGGLPIATTHLAVELMRTELLAFVAARGDGSGPSVVIASSQDDRHSLAGVALEAALAERGVNAVLLGSGVPPTAVAEVVAQLGPVVVFLWSAVPVPGAAEAVLETVPPATQVIFGGPGWGHVPQQRPHPTGAFVHTLERILAAVDQGRIAST